MPIFNSTSNLSYVKQGIQKFLSLGEKAKPCDFKMTVEGYPDAQYLVQSAQMPPISRESIELFGPMGIKFTQAGKVENSGELPITFIETVKGDSLKLLQEWALQKKYMTVTIELVSEQDNSSSKHKKCELSWCWLKSEAVELSVEDTTTPLKITGTLVYNWHSWLDG